MRQPPPPPSAFPTVQRLVLPRRRSSSTQPSCATSSAYTSVRTGRSLKASSTFAKPLPEAPLALPLSSTRSSWVSISFLCFLSITFFIFSVFSCVILYFKWVVGPFFVERKLLIIFELIVGLLKKKIRVFNFLSSSYLLTFAEVKKKKRKKEKKKKVGFARCWRCGWLVVSGAQC